MAETLTDKLKLSKRDTGDLNWGQGANANLDALDAHAQQATLRPPRSLLASLGSGAAGPNLAGSATYFYKVTAVNAAGETTEGKIPATVEAQVTESASPVPIILSWETVKGATGYKIYKATASGQEKFLASVSGESTLVYTDDGNTATNSSISVPASNTARSSVSKIVAGSNVTISPPDGTGDVTINAAGGTVPDASDTVKGITKLSVAPASPTNPIAVGDNDARNTNARTPTGAAGGDLSGTYPNPSVAKVNGVSVPASPAAGQVLTATGPTAAAWQTPAAGGGYASVVVAAPSGSAATDTANIQNAINAVAGSFGGTVVLREGNYLINSTLSIPSVVCLKGQGMDITTLFASGLPGSAAMITAGAGNNLIQIQDLTLNFNKAGRGTITALDDVHFTGQDNRFTRVKFIGNAGSTCLSFGTIANGLHNIVDECQFIMNGSFGGTAISGGGDLYVSNCYFNNTVTMLRMITVGYNAYICNNLFELGAGGTQVIFSNGGNDMNIANNTFQLIAGTWTNAIKAFGPTRYTIVGNTASATAAGDINCSGANGVIACNAGFASYTGGTQVANDTQTFNGVAVNATAPSAGQVLTATGPAAAAWQAPAGGGNWTLVGNLTNGSFGQTFTPDFTGLSLNTHRSYMLVFELSLSSNAGGPNWVALRLNGAAPTTLQQYMITDQQGATQDNEGSTNAMAKILKVFPGGGSSVEVSGCIIITGKVNSGFPHAVGWYTVTNQSAVEQMHRGNIGLRMNLGSGVDLTSLGLFSNSDLNFLVAGSCRMSLYQAQ